MMYDAPNTCCGYTGIIIRETHTHIVVVNGQMQALLRIIALCPRCGIKIETKSAAIGDTSEEGVAEAERQFVVYDAEELLRVKS